jgi:phage FluMu protein Com
MNEQNREVIESSIMGENRSTMQKYIDASNSGRCSHCGKLLYTTRIISAVEGSIYCERCAALKRAQLRYKEVRKSSVSH